MSDQPTEVPSETGSAPEPGVQPHEVMDEIEETAAAERESAPRRGRRRKGEGAADVATDEETRSLGASERGPFGTAQHQDDGWGDTPVQKRG